MRKSTKITAAIGGAALALGTAGVAYAYWTTTGGGTGSATTSSGSLLQLKVHQTSAPTANQLAPGQAGSTLAGTVENLTTAPNGVSYALKAVKIVLTVTKAGGAVAGTCDANDYLIVSPNQQAAYAVTTGAGTVTTNINADGSAYELTAGQDAAGWTSTLSFVNTTANQDQCKGATVNLTYTTVQS